MKYILCLCVFVALTHTCCRCQDAYESRSDEGSINQPWSDNEWEELQKTIDFGEAPQKEKVEPDDGHNHVIESDEALEQPSILNGDYGKGIAYGFIGLLVVGLVVLLLRSQVRSGQIAPTDQEPMDPMQEDLNVIETDFERLLRMAIEAQNWRLAVRLHFLDTIKKMHEQKLILWQKHKTNQDYIFEVDDKTTRSDFRHLVLVFEVVWYGEKMTTGADYFKVKGLFEKFHPMVNE
jgi:hypothetical protein